MKDYVIVGAGLSGLTTAYFLKKAGFSVQVVEANSQVGGRIQSQNPEPGWQVDIGANTALLSNETLDKLIDELEIRDQLLVANQTAHKRFIVRGNKLWPLPMSFWQLVRSPLVSPKAKLGLLLEPFIGPAKKEESIAEFVTRRLGAEWRDWVVDPFVSGIFAGNPQQLSVQAAFHRLWLLEKDHGSLFKGMLAKMKAKKKARDAGEYVSSNHMISFQHGMSTLTHALAGHLSDVMHLGEKAVHLAKLDEGWQLTTQAGHVYTAKQVIATVDAPDAAVLFKALSPVASSLLSTISSPPLAVVALGFDRHQIQHPLDGFGCLIPRSLGIPTLGAIFSSSIFAHRAPTGKVLLSCFLGGSRMPQVVTYSEAEIVQQVLHDLTPLLGIQGQPVLQKVKLWPHAIAQYQIGHLEKVAKIRQQLAQDLPGVVTRANWHEGISIPDVIANSERFARQQSILAQVKK